MRKEIAVKILNQTNISNEKLEKALLSQSKFFRVTVEFKESIDIILKEKNFHSIIIIVLNKRLNKELLEKIINLARNRNRINIVDTEKYISKTKKETLLQKESVKIIEETKDIYVLAFNILYDYYQENKNFIDNKNETSEEEEEKYNFVMNQYKECKNKDEILDLIDDFLLEGKSYNFQGYNELKTLILICIICKIKDRSERFLYVYRVVAEIHKKKEGEIRYLIGSALNSIKNRKLKVNEILNKLNGSNIVKQAIKLGEIIKKQNMDM